MSKLTKEARKGYNTTLSDDDSDDGSEYDQISNFVAFATHTSDNLLAESTTLFS